MSHTVAPMPLADVTNKRMALANQQPMMAQKQPLMQMNLNQQFESFNKMAAEQCQKQQLNNKTATTAPAAKTISLPARRMNDPYAWIVLPRDEAHAEEILRQREQERADRAAIAKHMALKAAQLQQLIQMQQQQAAAPKVGINAAPITTATPVSPLSMSHLASSQSHISYAGESTTCSPTTLNTNDDSNKENTSASFPSTPAAASGKIVCRCLVQFKCHHAEYASSMPLMKGQYVSVGGDRGIDIGIVIRINTDESKTYVEKTGPQGNVLRHATQREVDYWSTDLKADEAAALEYVRQRVAKHRLVMEVKHAEYQFDKKKLTFYYESKARVDFVMLLKDLFREFSCRIWMEKVRTGIHE